MRQFDGADRIIFLVEATSVTIFAGYWATKSAEFRKSAAEARALRGELEKKRDFDLVECFTQSVADVDPVEWGGQPGEL